MADTLIGFVGDDYVMIAADASANFSIIIMKDDEDKIMSLDSHKALAAAGEAGDRVQFCEFIQKNLALYNFRNGYPLTVHGAAHFIRGELATALRRNPYQVNLLLAGYDTATDANQQALDGKDKFSGPSLYYIDYLASMQRVDHGAHGYGSYFSLSILDKYYRKGLSLEEGIKLMERCISEVQRRLVLNSPRFVVKVIDKTGTRTIELFKETQPLSDAMKD